MSTFNSVQNTFDISTSDNDLIVGESFENNLIAGLDGDDIIVGGIEEDTLIGGNGEDSLVGTLGDDSLVGGAGSDIIGGGFGHDTILSGKGSDTVFGGAGEDIFAYAGDPFEGLDVSTSERQIVADEDFIGDFDLHDDIYRLDPTDFGISGEVNFIALDGNAPEAAIAPGTNVVVLLNSDNDNNPETPFLATTSAEQIAELTSEDGAGFFVYYNSELDLNRLVYSTNLNDPTADLKIISRQTNLTGQDAIAALNDFSADNFEFEEVELAPTNVQDGTTSVALDTELLESAAGLTLSSTDDTVDPISEDFAVGFDITEESDFLFNEADGFTPLGGTIKHTGTITFSSEAGDITVGDLSIGFDAERVSETTSGFFVANTVEGVLPDGAILFDVGVPESLAIESDNLDIGTADLLVAPEFANVLLDTGLAESDLTGADVGDTAIDASESLDSNAVSLNETADEGESIPIVRDNLFPESAEYNPHTEQFLLTSLTEGTIFTTNGDGSVSPFIEDERLISTIGLAIDEEHNRLLVANSDAGSSSNSSPETANQLAALGIYDLSTGEPIDYVDLSSLRPGEPHFANDLDIDDEGNIYVTDSFSPIIYQVDPEGNPSIFLEDEQFTGEGFNLNGIVAHPDDFLLVVDSNDGLLYKVPLDNPEQFTQVEIDRTLVSADGLFLGDEDELVVITNQSEESSNSIFNLQSDDNWESAEIVDELDLGDDVFPTTATTRENDLFVLDAQLNVLFGGGTTDEFAIAEVGAIDI